MKKVICIALLLFSSLFAWQEPVKDDDRKQILSNLLEAKAALEENIKRLRSATLFYGKNIDAFTPELRRSIVSTLNYLEQYEKKLDVGKLLKNLNRYIDMGEKESLRVDSFIKINSFLASVKKDNEEFRQSLLALERNIAEPFIRADWVMPAVWGAIGFATGIAIERWYEGLPWLSKQMVLRKLQNIKLKPEDISPAEFELLVIATKASLSATKHQRDTYFKKQIKALDFGTKPISDAVWQAAADLYFWSKPKNGIAQVQKLFKQARE